VRPSAGPDLTLPPAVHGDDIADRAATAAAELLAPGISELGVPVTVSRAASTEVSVGSAGGAPRAPAAGPSADWSSGQATAGSGPDGGGPEQVEALAQKLLGPLLRRIKAELLLDRERNGLRTDSW